MAKRRVKRAAPRRRRSYSRRRRRRRGPKKFPLSAGIGLIASATAGTEGFASPIEAMTQGDMFGAMQSFLKNAIGVTIPCPARGVTGPIFDFASLNPFDFNKGIGWKTAMWSSITMRLANAVSGGKASRMISSVPWIGKKISFS
jgi:hypothetical protein